VSEHGCPRVDDAGSYVLRAMPDGEWETYREHLGRCNACAQKVAELQFVGDALLSGVPQLTVPPNVRDRVMRVVRSESELLLAAGPAADRPEPRPQTRRRRRRLGLPALRSLPAAALASGAHVLSVGAGALMWSGDDAAHPRTVVAKVVAPGASATVRVSDGGTKLVVANMPAPDEGRVYQVWLDHGDGTTPQPTDALFSVSRAGRASVDVPGDLHGVKAVLVTDEPLGGSRVPSRAPVIAATLS
jgi:hypothetical protein